MHQLFSKGVGTQVHYIPVHTQPYFQKILGTLPEDCPIAMKYYDKALSLPLYPDMTDKDQDYVIEQIKYLVQSKK